MSYNEIGTYNGMDGIITKVTFFLYVLQGMDAYIVQHVKQCSKEF